MILELTDELRDALPKGVDPFEWFLQGGGEVHRHVKNRLTYEVHLGTLHFYVKRHLGCGWRRSAQGLVSSAQASGQRPH